MTQEFIYPDWQEYQANNLPKPWDYWLGTQGSLTQALERAGNQRCELAIQQEGYAKPWQDECEFLELNNLDQHWVREITLAQKNTKLVYARSVFPKELIAHHKEFLGLGNQVLAQVLFTNPNIYRGDIEIVSLNKHHELFKLILNAGLVDSDQALWARRSRFHVKNHCLLVCEVMLDAVENLSLSTKPT